MFSLYVEFVVDTDTGDLWSRLIFECVELLLDTDLSRQVVNMRCLLMSGVCSGSLECIKSGSNWDI